MRRLLIFAIICIFGCVADPSWNQVLPNLSTATSQPFVSAFSDGSAVAIWTESAGLTLKGAYFNPSTKAWGASVTIATSTIAITDYSIKTNDSGVALGVWLQSSALDNPGEPRGVQYTKSTNTWTALPTIWNADISGAFEQPSVGFLGNNLALFSATQALSPISLVFWENFRYYNFSTQTLQTNKVLDTLHNQFYSKSIGKTGSSQALSVYVQCAVNTDTDYTIAAASLTFPTTVATITTISTVGVDNTISPAVGSNLNGQAVVAWIQGGNLYASYLTSFASNTWSSPIALDSSSLITTAPLCVMDNSGNAVVSWLGSSSGTAVVRAVFFSGSTNTWSSTSNVSLLTSNASDPAVAVNSSGRFGFTWTQAGVILSRFYQSGAWTPGLTDAGGRIPGSGSGTLSSLCLSDSTDVRGVCVWQGSSVDSAYLGTLFSLSATGQQILIRYPVQGDLVNQLRWASNPAATSYQIYRGSLSELIGQTTAISFDDHQRQPNQTVTYYIRSLNSGGTDNGDLTTVTVSPIYFSNPRR